MTDYHIVVVGGGGTGVAVAYDLAARGFRATLLERGELTSGTTGRHHGQLHSGARYAVTDHTIGRECYHESLILRRIAPESIEFNQGLFVAASDEDAAYAERFIPACDRAGIPTRRIDGDLARRMEPALSANTRFAVLVPDGTIDAFRLVMQFAAAAVQRGADLRAFHEADGIVCEGGRAVGVSVRDHLRGRTYRLSADAVVNAAGAWAGRVAETAGAAVAVTPSPGVMVAHAGRLVNMVTSRLRPPGDGDILVPQRGLSIIGSTQWTADDPDLVGVPAAHVSRLQDFAAEMVPAFRDAPFHAAWSAPRPLAGTGGRDVRELSRDFSFINHGESDGVAGLYTIIGGKATVLRGMAEATVDGLCAAFGIDRPCTTAENPLPSHRRFYTGRSG